MAEGEFAELVDPVDAEAQVPGFAPGWPWVSRRMRRPVFGGPRARWGRSLL